MEQDLYLAIERAALWPLEGTVDSPVDYTGQNTGCLPGTGCAVYTLRALVSRRHPPSATTSAHYPKVNEKNMKALPPQ